MEISMTYIFKKIKYVHREQFCNYLQIFLIYTAITSFAKATWDMSGLF